MDLLYNDPNLDPQYQKQMRLQGVGAGAAGGFGGALVGAGIGAGIGTLIAPGVGTAVGASLGAAGGGIFGAGAGVLSSKQRRYTEALAKSQIERGQQAEKNLIRPVYQRPNEINQSLNIQKGMAEEGLSQQAKDYNQMLIDRNTAYALQQLEGRKAGIAGIGALNQGLNDNALELAMQDEAARRSYTQNYVSGLQNAAQYSDKEFDINKFQPYELALQKAMALQGAGLQNINTAYGQRGKAAMDYAGFIQGAASNSLGGITQGVGSIK